MRSSGTAIAFLLAIFGCTEKGQPPTQKTGATLFLPEPTKIVLEVESGTVEPPFEIVEDPDCSGGRCVVLAEKWATDEELHPAFRTRDGRLVSAKEDLGRNPAGVELIPNGRIELQFEVKKPGLYVLWARAHFHCSCGDSFYVSVDGGEPVDTDGNGEYDVNPPFVLGGSTHGRWKWFELKAQKFELGTGQHTIRIYNREDGIKLDQILLVETPPPLDPYVPQGIERPAP